MVHKTTNRRRESQNNNKKTSVNFIQVKMQMGKRSENGAKFRGNQEKKNHKSKYI
jgi:hypothetical protein